ncbi:MAG: hypothetical protein H7281_15335 [Bacteriovorax sp.]|nr:hypothetical protein [Bacteriovorax sp.]
MLKKNSSKKVIQNKDSKTENFLTLTIHKRDSMFFHVQISDFSSLDAMTKAEILEIEEKYKGSFNLIFKTKALEKMFNVHVDDPQYL